MKAGLKNFFKSIFIGIGGIAPGLSGSVLMIIFGLYQDVINALGSIFKNFKKKFLFLLPIVLGMGIGMLGFSKIMDFFLENFEMQTRFMFLGLILGTVPLFNRELRKEGFKRRYYFVILGAFLLSFFIFTLNPESFPQIENPNLLQKLLLGVAVIASAIVPGVDSAVILSSLGLYELYVSSVAHLDFAVLIPMAVGAVVGGLVISFIVSRLFRRFYTASFSVVFGMFLAMIPNIINESCSLALDVRTFVSFLLLIVGLSISLFMSNAEENIKKIKARIKSDK